MAIFMGFLFNLTITEMDHFQRISIYKISSGIFGIFNGKIFKFSLQAFFSASVDLNNILHQAFAQTNHKNAKKTMMA